MVFKRVTNPIFTNSEYDLPFVFFFFSICQILIFSLRFGRRTAPYGPTNYVNDVASLITAMDANPRILNKNMLIGPSVATGPWTPEQVWDTGFVNKFQDRLYSLAVEQCVFLLTTNFFFFSSHFLFIPVIPTTIVQPNSTLVLPS